MDLAMVIWFNAHDNQSVCVHIWIIEYFGQARWKDNLSTRINNEQIGTDFLSVKGGFCQGLSLVKLIEVMIWTRMCVRHWIEAKWQSHSDKPLIWIVTGQSLWTRQYRTMLRDGKSKIGSYPFCWSVSLCCWGRWQSHLIFGWMVHVILWVFLRKTWLIEVGNWSLVQLLLLHDSLGFPRNLSYLPTHFTIQAECLLNKKSVYSTRSHMHSVFYSLLMVVSNLSLIWWLLWHENGFFL
jgi:hypothetical protein